MAKYPKFRKTYREVKMADGWKRITSNIPALPDTTKYTRFYGDYRVDIYHKKGERKYTYSIFGPHKSYFADFYATSLKKAQEFMDLSYGDLATRRDFR